MRIIATRLLVWAEAMTITPELILMRPGRMGDEALLAHEMTHCRQMRRVGTVVWWWRYVTDRKFRLTSELEAYRVQIAMAPWALDAICTLLATRYFLGITPQQAKALLLQPAR